MSQRIAKFLSAAGVCSRRDAERMILEGRVFVNGQKLETPATLVTDNDAVKVDGKLVKSASLGPRLWIYHKPTGLVTSHRDEKGRNTVFDHLPKSLPRVVSVGRLDLNSEGLLLLTTSGELSRALELPRNALPRTYRVRIRGTPSEKHLHMLSKGVKIDEMKYAPIEVQADAKKDGRNQWLTLTLKEGKNREIRRIFEHFDYPVNRLIRIAYGPFKLDTLEPGEAEEVPTEQVEQLMKKLKVGA